MGIEHGNIRPPDPVLAEKYKISLSDEERDHNLNPNKQGHPVYEPLQGLVPSREQKVIYLIQDKLLRGEPIHPVGYIDLDEVRINGDMMIPRPYIPSVPVIQDPAARFRNASYWERFPGNLPITNGKPSEQEVGSAMSEGMGTNLLGF